jgi:hypothetical protein
LAAVAEIAAAVPALFPGRQAARCGKGREHERPARLIVALLLLGSCAAPLVVERLDPQAAYHRLSRSALADDLLSETSRTTLRRHGLLDSLRSWPEFFALAETSYLRARQTGSQGRHLAAAIYAYAFLFPEAGSADRPNPFDPRLRQASDLYNLALAAAVTPVAGGPAVFRSGRHPRLLR